MVKAVQKHHTTQSHLYCRFMLKVAPPVACVGANQYLEMPITITTTSVGKEHHTIAKCMCCHNRLIDTDILNVCIYT